MLIGSKVLHIMSILAIYALGIELHYASVDYKLKTSCSSYWTILVKSSNQLWQSWKPHSTHFCSWLIGKNEFWGISPSFYIQNILLDKRNLSQISTYSKSLFCQSISYSMNSVSFNLSDVLFNRQTTHYVMLNKNNKNGKWPKNETTFDTELILAPLTFIRQCMSTKSIHAWRSTIIRF